MPRSAAPRKSAAYRGRATRRTSPPSSRTSTRAWGTRTSSRAGWRRRSINTRRRLRSDPRFTTCGISWGACCSRRDAPWTHESTSKSSYGRAPTIWTPPRCWGSPATSRATGSRPGPCGKTAASAGPRIRAWRPTWPCWPATTPPPKCRRSRPRRTPISRPRPPDPTTADGRRHGEPPGRCRGRPGARVPAQRPRPRGAGGPLVRRRFLRDALAEYQLGLKAHPGDADLEAKLGAAALHVGDYATAVNAYIALGEGDRSRAGEAADGLERTARAALAANDRSAAARSEERRVGKECRCR